MTESVHVPTHRRVRSCLLSPPSDHNSAEAVGVEQLRQLNKRLPTSGGGKTWRPVCGSGRRMNGDGGPAVSPPGRSPP